MSRQPNQQIQQEAQQFLAMVRAAPLQLTTVDIIRALNLPWGRWQSVLYHARQIARASGGLLPRPLKGTGFTWVYTGDWLDPNQPGLADSLLVNLRNVHTIIANGILDMNVAANNLPPRSASKRHLINRVGQMAGQNLGVESDIDYIKQELGIP